MGRYQEAYDIFEALRKTNTDDWEPLHGLGLIAMSKQHFELAEPLLLAADQLHPNDYMVLGTLVLIYSHQGRCRESAQLVSRLLSLYPENAQKLATVAKCPQ
jgi:Flp pilus assembly protein TadD